MIIPEISEEMDLFAAAAAYAKAGLYCFPVNAKTRKPWETKWQEKSSRDVKQLAAWFLGAQDVAVAIHVGRSGAMVLDVDTPELMPAELRRALAEMSVPFHASREEHNGRGHYWFALPEGRMVSNSRGQLIDYGSDPAKRLRAWGEVRGRNGFVVVAPSDHAKGGLYQWVTTGAVPTAPEYLLAKLPDSTEDGADAASDATVAAFMARHTHTFSTGKLDAICEHYTESIKPNPAAPDRPPSRHEAMVHCVAWAMREAQDDWFPATAARDRLWALFNASMQGEDRPFFGEFHSAVAWAVGQALLVPSAKAKLAPPPAAEPTARVIDLATRREREQPAEAPRSVWMDDDEDETLAGPADDASFGPAGTSLMVESGADPRGTDGYFGEVGEPARKPREYFLDKEAGLDVELLAQDVINIGPLAWGHDNRWWAYREGVWRCEPEVVVGRCTRLLKGRYRPTYDRAAHNMVRHHREVLQLNFKPVEPIMNFSNTLLDWRTGEKYGHTADVHTTIQFPVAYDPDAECPLFERFLAQILDEDAVRLMWQIIGYLMLAGNPRQVAVMFVGGGGNGKGTVLRVLQHLLGDRNTSKISLDSLNTDKFAPSGLFGKIANLAGDIDATFQESTAAFKTLTGEDQFRAQMKYGQPFDFESYAVPVFSANKVPGSADTSTGYLRRWLVVPFNISVPADKRVLGLSNKFITPSELAGVAARGVAALRELEGGGYQFHRKGSIEEAFEQFAEDIDRVRQWLDQCAEVREGATETQSTAYKSFQAWAHENGAGSMSSKEFISRLGNIDGLRPKKVQGARAVEGLRVTRHRYNAEPVLTQAQAALGGDFA